jgi:hypothetical protein
MRKTMCAFALTLILSGSILAGEIPNGGNTPPPPPPPPPTGEFVGENPDGRALALQTSDETVTEYILNLIQNVLTLY